jgi:DNA-binding CsgD family transcriptional regulator
MSPATVDREATVLGRETVLQDIGGLFRETVSGRGSILVLEGEPGIGKTSVLTASLAQARAIGLHVVKAGAQELERHRPFGILIDCFGIARGASDPVRAHIARLLMPDVLAPDQLGHGPQLEFQVAEAIVGFVEDIATQHPLVIAVEDLHWADRGSLLVLQRLARLVSQWPIVLVGTSRPIPARSELAALVSTFRAQGGLHRVLGPLQEKDVVALTRAILGYQPGPNLLQLLAAAGGNPLFVTELLRALHDPGVLDVGDGVVDISSTALPPPLGVAVLARLSQLPVQALEVLQFASVLGSAFFMDELAAFVGRPATDIVAILREAMADGVLRTDGMRLAFRHDLFREALYGDLAPALRAGLHRQAARTLAQIGTTPQHIGEHLLRGARPGDQQAIEGLHRAAKEAAGPAPATAVELLKKALELAGPRHRARDGMLADLATSLQQSGRFAEAEAICREALAREHDPKTAGAFRLGLIVSLGPQGRVRESAQEADAMVDSPLLTSAERAELRARAAWSRAFLAELDAAANSANIAAAEAIASGNQEAASTARATISLVAYLRGHFCEAAELAADAARQADPLTRPNPWRFLLHLLRAHALIKLGQLDAAGLEIERGAEVEEEVGGTRFLPSYHQGRALVAYVSGRLGDADAELATGLQLADEMGHDNGKVPMHSLRGMIALHRGHLAEAESSVLAAERVMAVSGPQYGLDWFALARALVEEAKARPERALAVLVDAWDGQAAAGIASGVPVLGPEVVRLALLHGDRGRAERTTHAIEALVADAPGPVVDAVALWCRGLLSADSELLLAAARTFRDVGWTFYEARACEEAGVALAATGRTEDARHAFLEGRLLYERLDMARDGRRAEARMRSCGLRLGRRGSRKRPTSGWESLTETERRVAELVAQRLSNPEIAQQLYLSRHTVHTHVSHVLAKLGISSRLELAQFQPK